MRGGRKSIIEKLIWYIHLKILYLFILASSIITMKWDDIFVKSVLVEKVKLAPKELHSAYQDVAKKRLMEKVEGKCTKHGFIRPGSVDVLTIYMGAVEAQTFRGYVTFNVRFRAEVCNPPIGAVITAKVSNINSFGVLCVCGFTDENKRHVSALEIIVPKQSVSIKSEVDLMKLKLGQEVNIEIMGRKYELDDKRISIMGRVVKSVKIKKSQVATEEDMVVQEVENELTDLDDVDNEYGDGDEDEDYAEMDEDDEVGLGDKGGDEFEGEVEEDVEEEEEEVEAEAEAEAEAEEEEEEVSDAEKSDASVGGGYDDF
jgi:DNA-directed RNA polymerase subunit E'/Rpb7